MTRIETVRRKLGARVGIFLVELFERGLEVALAGITVINGHNALSVDANGAPLAPFLNSALRQLSYSSSDWAITLMGFGALHLVVLLFSIRRVMTPLRLVLAVGSFFVYVAVATAVLTGAYRFVAAERYLWSAAMSLLCSVALFLQWKSSEDEKEPR